MDRRSLINSQKISSFLILFVLLFAIPIAISLGEAWGLTNAPDYLGDPSVIQNQGFRTWVWCGDYWPTYRDSINYRWDSGDSPPAEKIEKAFGLIQTSNNPGSGPVTVQGTNVSVDVSYTTHWKESQKQSNSFSNWSLIPFHLRLSIGWPPSSIGLPKAADRFRVFTNADSWEFLRVTDNDGDGKASSIKVKIIGKPGTKGTFGVLLPKALLKKWKLNKGNVGGFVNGRKVKSTVRKASKNAGLIVSFKVTYPVRSVAVGKAK